MLSKEEIELIDQLNKKHFWRIKELCQLLKKGRHTWHALVEAKKAPAPYRLLKQKSFWRDIEIIEFMLNVKTTAKQKNHYLNLVEKLKKDKDIITILKEKTFWSDSELAKLFCIDKAIWIKEMKSQQAIVPCKFSTHKNRWASSDIIKYIINSKKDNPIKNDVSDEVFSTEEIISKLKEKELWGVEAICKLFGMVPETWRNAIINKKAPEAAFQLRKNLKLWKNSDLVDFYLNSKTSNTNNINN